MWNKLSNVLRRSEDGHIHEHTHMQHTRTQQPAVLGQMRYGNLDILCSNEDNASREALPTTVECPGGFEAEAPLIRPESPTLMAAAVKPRRSLFKRSSRYAGEKEKDYLGANGLARRVKSSLAINTNLNGSNVSLASLGPTSATESVPETQSQPFASMRSIFKDRKAFSNQVQTLMNNVNKSSDTLARGSLDVPRPLSPIRSINSVSELPPIPATPGDPQRMFPSVRSILRDKNVPGSGQNVRFFSRDAYRVISPETSTSNTDSSKFISANGVLETGSSNAVGGGDMFTSFDASAPMSTSTPHPALRYGTSVMPIPPAELMFGFSAAAENGVHPIPEVTNGQGSRTDTIENDHVGITKTDCPEKDGQPRPIHRNPSISDSDHRNSTHSAETAASFDPRGINSNESSVSLAQQSTETPFQSFENLSQKHRRLSTDLITFPVRPSTSLSLHKILGREGGSHGETSVEKASPRSSFDNLPARGRVRAISERVLVRSQLGKDSMLPGSEKGSAGTPPRTSAGEAPDPFRADASNYYNRAAGFPNSPPKIAHVRSDSGVTKKPRTKQIRSSSNTSSTSHASSSISTRMIHSPANISKRKDEDELVMALRTQLAFHQELTSQYEVDLGARDQIVALLSAKLRSHEEEGERRGRTMRAMRRKMQELERACRVLEEQADQSRQSSFKREGSNSVGSDEVSTLRQQVEKLEKEKEELECRAQEAVRESERLRKEIDWRDIDTAEPTMRDDGDESRLQTRAELEDALAISDKHSQLVKELEARQREIDMLKQEVEAQWGNTEKMNAQIEALKRERDRLRVELTNLESRLSKMEVEWTDSENRRMEAETALANSWQARDRAEAERDQLREEAAQERALREEIQAAFEMQMKSVKDEFCSASENEERLQLEIRGREAEIDAMHTKLADREEELDTLHTELTQMRRDHARTQAEVLRVEADVAAWDVRAQDDARQLASATRAQSEAENETRRLHERLASLQEEADRLRRQAHGLKQHSADHDVRILQMQRQHEQDMEDKLGLNMALDAKQQELELIKRSMGVRGTAGATPAVSSRAASRRDSVDFKTPRPSSALSEQTPSWLTEAAVKLGQTPFPVRPALAHTSRANALVNPAAQYKGRKLQASNSTFNPFQSASRPSLLRTITRHRVSAGARADRKRKSSRETDDELAQPRGRTVSSASSTSATTDEMTDEESKMRLQTNVNAIVDTVPFMDGTSSLEADPTMQSDKENTPVPRQRNLVRESVPF